MTRSLLPAKAAPPPRVVAALDESQHLSPAFHLSVVRLNLDSRLVWRELAELVPHHTHQDLVRNLGCLRTLVTAALFLAGTLGPSWPAVPRRSQMRLTFLPHVVPCLVQHTLAPAAAGTPNKCGGTQIEGRWNNNNRGIGRQRIQPLRTSIPRACKLPCSGCLTRDRVRRLCVSLFCWRIVQVELGIPSASTSATSLVTPRTEWFSRRRVSGIYILRTLVRHPFAFVYPN